MSKYEFKSSFFHSGEVIDFGITDVRRPSADRTSWRFDVLQDGSIITYVIIHLTGTDKTVLANHGIDPELVLLRKFTQWYRQGQRGVKEIYIQRSDKRQTTLRQSREKYSVRHSVMETIHAFYDEGFQFVTLLQIVLSCDFQEEDINNALGWLNRRGWIVSFGDSSWKYKDNTAQKPKPEQVRDTSIVEAHDPVFKTAYKLEPAKVAEIEEFLRSSPMNEQPHRHFQEVPVDVTGDFAFVIMPFREEEFPQGIYFNIIKPFVDGKFKIRCVRVDEDFTSQNILNKIYTYTVRSDFVIAEISTRNPNVMYELGLALALGKDVIVVENKEYASRSRWPERIFDIDKFPYYRYGDDNELRDSLDKAIIAHLSTDKK